MKNAATKAVRVSLFLAVFALGGCSCLQKVTLTPELTAVDLATAKAGSAKFAADITFKDCCPTEAQKKIALQIQSGVADLYGKLIRDEITLEAYNQKISAAKTAIEKVVLVCQPQKEGVKAQGALDAESPLVKAWKEAEDAANQLK